MVGRAQAQWRRLRWGSRGGLLLWAAAVLLSILTGRRLQQQTLNFKRGGDDDTDKDHNDKGRIMERNGSSYTGQRPHQHQQQQQRILLVTYLFSDNDDVEGSNTTLSPLLRLFLKTAATSGVDLCLVGNVRSLLASNHYVLPANVKFHYISWDDLINLAASRIGFDGTALRESRNYYKVIDFKPTLGYLFPDLLHGYDWWGHVDNDLLLGNVRGIVEKFLDDFDVIGGIPIHPTWGPFTMYRNVERINTLFFNASLPMQEIFGLPLATWFDEWQEHGPLKHVPYATMSGIIERNRDSVRVKQGVGYPIGDGPWGECGPDKQHPRPRCNECLYYVATSPPRPRLIWRPIPFYGQYHEKLLCHYEFSKHRVNEQMSRLGQEMVDDLLERVGEFRVNAVDGLLPISDDDRWLLTAHEDVSH
jgi:hypothetical protein